MFVIDKTNITNYKDVEYVKNENEAIYKCQTKYIYFVLNNSILQLNFVNSINKYLKHNYDIIQFNINDLNVFSKKIIKYKSIENFSYYHNIYNKIFNVEFLTKNYISFSNEPLLIFSYITFFYKTLLKSKSILTISKNYVIVLKEKVNKKKFTRYYLSFLAKIKKICYEQKNNNDLTSYIKLEDLYYSQIKNYENTR